MVGEALATIWFFLPARIVIIFQDLEVGIQITILRGMKNYLPLCQVVADQQVSYKLKENMTEVDLDIEHGRKRRLPVWMLGVSASDERSESEDRDENLLPLQDKLQYEATRTKAKSATRKSAKKVLTQEIKASDENHGLLLRCEMGGGTRKMNRRDRDPNTASCSEVGLQKKARKNMPVGEQGTGRKSVVASRKQNVDGNENSSNKELDSLFQKSEDEVELTVEDLVSIAQEHVNGGKEKQQHHASSGASKLEAPISSSVVSLKNRLGGSFGGDGSRLQISKCTTTSHSSHQTETKQEKESPTLDMLNVPSNISRTGNAAQDMLDLFLGPLLKKPPAEERKLERTTTGEIALACDSSKEARSGFVRDANLPLTKKKSSLKDKVAMFLD